MVDAAVIVDDPGAVQWDEDVDLICVGPAPAALAAAVAADASGLEVLLTHGRGRVDAQTLAGRLGLRDDSAEYLDRVTQGAGTLVRPGAAAELPVWRTDEPRWPDPGPGISFSGAALRDWAVACLGSPYGLLRTAVSDAVATAQTVGTIDIGHRVDVGDWLDDRARERDLTPRADTALSSLVFAAGRVAGAVLQTPEGDCLVRATGVVIPTGAAAPLPRLAPGDAERADLVVLARPFSRFARLELRVRT